MVVAVTIDVMDPFKGLIKCIIKSFIIGAIFGVVPSIFFRNFTAFDITLYSSIFGLLGIGVVRKGDDDDTNQLLGLVLAMFAAFGVFAGMFAGGFTYYNFTGIIDSGIVVSIITGAFSGATSV